MLMDSKIYYLYLYFITAISVGEKYYNLNLPSDLCRTNIKILHVAFEIL